MHVVNRKLLTKSSQSFSSQQFQPFQLLSNNDSFQAKPKSGHIHERLFKEHVLRAQKRLSIQEFDRRDKEAQLAECTFQPNLTLTQTFNESVASRHESRDRKSCRSSQIFYEDMVNFDAKRSIKLQKLRKASVDQF